MRKLKTSKQNTHNKQKKSHQSTVMHHRTGRIVDISFGDVLLAVCCGLFAITMS